MRDDEKFGAVVEAALDKARVPEGARNALAMLFPKIERAIETYVPSDREEDAPQRTRRLRASTREFASIYFGLDPTRATWGIDELDQLLDRPPFEFFREIVDRIEAALEKERPRLRRLFLEALRGAFGENRSFSEEWLHAIVDFSTYFLATKDEVTPHLFTVENEDRLRWLLLSAFEPLSVDRRADLLKGVIPAANDISLLCEFVRGIAGDKNPEGSQDPSRRSRLNGRSEEVRELLLARVRHVAAQGDLWSQARPATILWFWWGAVLDDEVRRFTDNVLDLRVAHLCLMDISINLVRSSAGDYERVNRSWSKIVDLERLEHMAEEYTRAGDEADRKVARRFLAALKRGRDSSF